MMLVTAASFCNIFLLFHCSIYVICTDSFRGQNTLVGCDSGNDSAGD